MRDIFTSDRNFSFKADISRPPRGFNRTDIDLMIRGKREMVAVELKHIKNIPEQFEVTAHQYYTYKHLSIRGIPSFYFFSKDDGTTLVYFVDRYAEPKSRDGKLLLPYKNMVRHKSLDEALELVYKIIKAEETYKKTEVIELVKKLSGVTLEVE